jgi:long-chain fatty acid transport protein
MIRKSSVAIIQMLLILIATATAIHAQDNEGPYIVENSAGNFFGVGARAVGMGGAQIAAGLDGTALVYNPALLARIRRLEVMGGVSHEKLSNDENTIGQHSGGLGLDGRSKSFTRLNSLNLTIPVPTYRGSAVVAFGINRMMSFDHVFRSHQYWTDGDSVGTEVETGGILMYSAAGAIDISPRVSVGLSLNLYHGKDDYTFNLSYTGSPTPGQRIESSEYVKADYTGVSATAGVVTNVNRNVSVGAVVESPISFDIDGEFSHNWYDHSYYKYELRHPFSFGIGVAGRFEQLQLAADLRYTDWSQLEYTDHEIYAFENTLIGSYYRDVVRISLGAEYLIQQIGAKLRLGYVHDPLPYADFLVKDERNFVTFGAGFLIDRVMKVDLAYVRGSYEYSLPTPDAHGFFDVASATFEKYTVSRVYVTTAFRI